MVDRASLIRQLENYHTSFEEEEKFISSFLELLEHPRCYHRDHLPGHLTGSAWIIDSEKEKVLLTHHAKLNRWLQPGGHADGDENLIRVALKEAEEETGLKSFTQLTSNIFDIDIHTIPERNGFPEHLHFDLRILLQASENDALLISEESHDLSWIHVKDIGTVSKNNASMLRMAEKVKALF